MEQSRNIERSEVWKQIYKEVKTLPIDAKGMDAPDAHSVTTSIEQLFLKLLPIHGVVLQSEQLCDNPHCEDGIVDRDMYGHPIYCQVCDSHN